LIRIEEELVIVRAYLQIEELRLGSKLRSEIEVDDDALQAEVPVLSIQPLVENAIKHGVAPRQSAGFVRIRIKRHHEEIAVEISNSGPFRGDDRENGTKSESGTNGVGLANVRRRLALCYGNENNLTISSFNDVTSVRFSIPVTPSVGPPVRMAEYAGRS
jgi:two-component system LytT family sensor kinase